MVARYATGMNISKRPIGRAPPIFKIAPPPVIMKPKVFMSTRTSMGTTSTPRDTIITSAREYHGKRGYDIDISKQEREAITSPMEPVPISNISGFNLSDNAKRLLLIGSIILALILIFKK